MRRSFARGALLLSLVAVPAFGQAPAGPEFRVNGYTTGAQGRPSVSVDPSGNFVVVWLSEQSLAHQGIVGQRFDRLGQPRGSEFLVSGYTTHSLFDSQVATDPSGGFMVAWGDLTSNLDVWGRTYDANGDPRGAPFLLTAYTTGGDAEPSIASRPDGSFVAVWRSLPLDGSSTGIAGQRFDGSGSRLGSQFIVNTNTTSSQVQPAVAADAGGNFVVVWSSSHDGDDGIFGQRFTAAATPIGSEFPVHSSTAPGLRRRPRVAAAPGGGFVVVWPFDRGDFSPVSLRARRFDAAGAPQGGEFEVSTTLSNAGARIAMDAQGRFVVAWSSFEDGSEGSIHARWYAANGTPRGRAFRVNTATTLSQVGATVGSDPEGNVVVAWNSPHAGDDDVYVQRHGLLRPAALAVDPSFSGTSNGNSVLEAGETVSVRPSWENASSAPLDLTGALTGITGPPGATYTVNDGIGAYGNVPALGTRPCVDCYSISVSAPPTRPALHWDARATEVIGLDDDGHQGWVLHVGDSFSDVPRTSPFYRFVEAMLHHGISGGCGGAAFCPAGLTTREQMAPFLLIAKNGASYVPKACTTPLFADVPASSPFCRWIEELAYRGVTAGCGGGNYCPTQPVTREQMTVFVLRMLDPDVDPPACGAPMFADVPASSPFCRWIEELARRGVVAGCGGGNFCPTLPVTREQMAVFLTGTFALTLYGP